jgi:hypothetical protein
MPRTLSRTYKVWEREFEEGGERGAKCLVALRHPRFMLQ